MVSGQQLKFKQASAKVRAEGIKPFTKAFGARMKQLLKSSGRRTKSAKRSTSKRSKPSKKQRSKSKASSRSTRSSRSKKMVGKKGGKSGKTRLRNLLIGFGVGAGVSTAAGLLRTPELEAAGPIIDALAGTGVEGQLGTAIPRLIRQVLIRTNGFSNGPSNGLALEGA